MEFDTVKRTEGFPLVFLVGPTGVGKTALALDLAQALGTEILNADSRQVYRLLDIGTAKATPEEQARVPHHLIDLVWPDQGFSVADYLGAFQDAWEKRFVASGKVPLIVGGTGLYVRAITRGLFKGPGADPALRRELKAFAQEHGLGALHLRLEKVDPEAAHRIHPHDLRRTIRALEVYLRTGTPISRLQQEETSIGFPVPSLIFGLTRNRRELYGRIDQRAEAMLERGLIEEAQGLLDRGYAESSGQRAEGSRLNQLPALEAFGYRDLIDYLRGRRPLEEALCSFQRDTKRYAKRQLTWFSRERVLRWFDLSVVSHKEALSNMVEEIGRVISPS